MIERWCCNTAAAMGPQRCLWGVCPTRTPHVVTHPGMWNTIFSKFQIAGSLPEHDDGVMVFGALITNNLQEALGHRQFKVRQRFSNSGNIDKRWWSRSKVQGLRRRRCQKFDREGGVL